MLQSQAMERRKFYTNSTINLGSQYSFQSKNLNMVWKRRHYIKSLAQAQVVSTHYQYLCSPLDQNCYIDVDIMVQNKTIQQRTLGPIQLQSKLTSIALPNIFETRVILNKNQAYPAKFSFNPHQTEIFSIKIQDQTMSLSNVFICDQRWKNLQPSQTDPNVLLLNIKPIKTQFLNFIKKLFIPIHVGETLKILFHDRFSRDLFLLRVIQWAPSYNQISESRETIVKQASINKKPYSRKKDPQTVVEEISLERSKSDIKDDVSVDIKIMEDIYDVLYTPTNNTPRKLYGENLYRHQFMEQNGNSKKTIETIKKDKRRGSLSQKKEEKQFIQQSFGYASTKKDQVHEINPNLYNTSRPDMNYSNERVKKHQFNHELIQIFLEDPNKIQSLININQEIVSENQQLKKENVFLQQQLKKYANGIYTPSSNYLSSKKPKTNKLHEGYRQSQHRKGSFTLSSCNLPVNQTSIQTSQVFHLREMMEEMSKRLIRLQQKERVQQKKKVVSDQIFSKVSSNDPTFEIDNGSKKEQNKEESNCYWKKQKVETKTKNTKPNLVSNYLSPTSNNQKAGINSFGSPKNNNMNEQTYQSKTPKAIQTRNQTSKFNERPQYQINIKQLQSQRLARTQKFNYNFNQFSAQIKKPSFLQYKVNAPKTYQRSKSKSPIKK